MTPPRVLVVTIVHQPLDARIHARQIRSMREAGWHVTYAAPWTATASPCPSDIPVLDLPRAVGRRRWTAIRAARHMLRKEAREHDLVLLHDPELLVGLAGLRHLPPVVWDVHEDAAASLTDRAWVPAWLRPVLRAGIRAVERRAERHHHLILAEESYSHRFRAPHPLIRNLPWVPEEVHRPGSDRAVYLGRISRSRGLDTLLAVAERLSPDITLELIGPADPDVEAVVEHAHECGEIRWHGFVDNVQALTLVEGAAAGLSLLRDEPNFRGSLPTKVAEYMARGVPVVTTPLPEAVRLLDDGLAGAIVPFDDPAATAEAIVRFAGSRDLRERAAAAGREIAIRDLDWRHEADHMLQHLRTWAQLA